MRRCWPGLLALADTHEDAAGLLLLRFLKDPDVLSGRLSHEELREKKRQAEQEVEQRLDASEAFKAWAHSPVLEVAEWIGSILGAIGLVAGVAGLIRLGLRAGLPAARAAFRGSLRPVMVKMRRAVRRVKRPSRRATTPRRRSHSTQDTVTRAQPASRSPVERPGPSSTPGRRTSPGQSASPPRVPEATTQSLPASPKRTVVEARAPEGLLPPTSLVRRWRPGDPVDASTARGTVPSRTTLRERAWKNEAAKPGAADRHAPEDLRRMRKGRAPRTRADELEREPAGTRSGGKTPGKRSPGLDDSAGLRRGGGGRLERSATNPRSRTYTTSTGKRIEIRPSKRLPSGEGVTSWDGVVEYSTRGSRVDRRLAYYHEMLHGTLTPRLKPLQALRKGAYKKSELYRYVEEALAEANAQLRVHGLRGLPEAIRFPISNGYVTVNRVAGEAAAGAIVVGGVAYAVSDSE